MAGTLRTRSSLSATMRADATADLAVSKRPTAKLPVSTGTGAVGMSRTQPANRPRRACMSFLPCRSVGRVPIGAHDDWKMQLLHFHRSGHRANQIASEQYGH
ncbi:hypothetical protein HF313_16360 [Massilia atriviolacea]|uniref:Uncharacterized protein n=1 Tax=Massilia atriviolacea TaxID=2495579 RepID=A0A430HUH9_9BURK|nr:hypothetical protein [Massilia atriviolacea]RSZ61115.1 hypothetical protein EJB06_03035 [Massilia atriviolacea]